MIIRGDLYFNTFIKNNMYEATVLKKCFEKYVQLLD